MSRKSNREVGKASGESAYRKAMECVARAFLDEFIWPDGHRRPLMFWVWGFVLGLGRGNPAKDNNLTV